MSSILEKLKKRFSPQGIKLGSIFEINTPKGKAYLHYICKDKTMGELIRVLPGLYQERPVSFDNLADSEEMYMIFFPLSAANKRKIVEQVGYYPINGFKKPAYMKTKFKVRGEFLGWHIVDTKTFKRKLVTVLTPEQQKLSPWGIYNDTFLIENLINDWNINNWNETE